MADLLLAVPKSDFNLEIENPSLDGENSEQNVFVRQLLEHGDSVGGCDGSRLNLKVFDTRTPQGSLTDRASHIHTARVYLAQSRHFTHRARGFSFVLLQWAANARRRAMAIKTGPAQGDLFGGKA